MKIIFYVIVIFVSILSGAKPVFAATGPDYWEGNSSVNFEDIPDNWTELSTNNPPVTGDSWVFDAAGLSGTTLNNNLSSYTVSGITFNSDASAFTINGNSITLTGNVSNNSSNNETLGIGIASGTVTNSGTGSGNTIISGNIGPGVTSVTQQSTTSNLILSGTNSYSGATTVSSGILNIQSNGALSGSGATVASGATLQLEGDITTGDVPLTLNGTGTSSNGALENVSGSNTFAGSIILNSPSQINSDSGILTLSGGINGDGNDLTVGGAGNTTISSAFAGSGSSLTQEGTGTLTLSTTNTYTGATTVSSGILNVQSSGALSGSGVTVSSGATLQLEGSITTSAIPLTLNGTGANGNGALENVSGNNTYTGSITLGSATQINSDSGLLTLNDTTDPITGGYDLTIGGNGNTTINNNIEIGAGAFTNDSTGIVILNGTNTYSGGTVLSNGTLELGSANAIGTGTITFSGGTLQYSVASAGTDYSSQFNTGPGQEYSIDTNGQDVIFGTALNSSNGTLTKIGSGTLTLSVDNNYTGTTTISGGTLQIGNGGSTGSLGEGNVIDNANLTFDLSSSPTISNIISGTGSVTQSGTGTVLLSGANTYSGATIVNNGTLEAQVINQAFGVGSAVAVGTGATLDLAGFNEIIGSLAGTGTVTSSTGNAILTVGNASSTIFSGNLQDDISGTIGLNKTGSGTLILSGTNAYSGGTTVSDGTLNLDSANAIGSGTITFAGGTFQYTNASANNGVDYSSQFSTTASNQAFNIDTNDNSVVYNNSLTSNGGGSLTKMGLGTLTLNAASTYSGTTTIEGGTLQTEASGAIPSTSDVSIASGAALDLYGNPTTIGSLAGAGTVTSSTGGSVTLTTGDDIPTTFSGSIQDGGGTMGLVTTGSGTLILSGNSSYSGGTQIGSGSTVQVESPNALGAGPVTNEGTLALGTTNLSVDSDNLGAYAYTQAAGSNLDVTISASSYGSIISAIAASVAGGSFVNVTVSGNVAGNETFDIINTGGAGIGSEPTIITLNSLIVSFTSSISGGDLVLTSENIGFVPFANNANARAVASALDNEITNPTNSDMATILGTLETLNSNAKIAAALNTMGPVVDGGVIENTNAALNNFIGATLDRLQNVLSRQNVINGELNKIEGTVYGNSGVSSGDETEANGIWAKPYGGYMTQGTLQGIQGYDAWNAGTVVGYDRMINDNFALGISGGYAYGQVVSDVNNANTDITSAQGTIYAGYQNPEFNYFINAAGSFAWNWYDGDRDINIGSINRVADSNYDGQQFGTYLGGGYNFNLGGNLDLTPLASLQWTHLNIDSYTETNAGSLDLIVNSQSYDLLESGLGASISCPEQYIWGNFTPEFHVKWLYDFINDDMSVTSTFTGGGGSFTSNGASPAKEGANIGGKLTFDFNNSISLIAQIDTTLKDQFFGIYGSGTVRYKF